METDSPTEISAPSFLAKIRDKLHFPYSDDKLFSIVFFATLFVPIAFFGFLLDSYESPKLFLWLLCSGLSFIVIFKHRPDRYRYRWFTMLVAAFFLWSVVSSIFSLDHVYSLFGLNGRYTSSILFYGLWSIWMMCLLFTLTRDKLLYLLKTLVVASLAIALLAILQYHGIAFYYGLDAPQRSLIPSFLGNPNFSSMFLTGTLPLALYFLITATRRFSVYYYAITGFIILWSFILFSSRGAILGLAIGLVIFIALALIYYRQKRTLLVSLLTLLIGSGLFLAFYTVQRPDSIQETVALSEVSVSNRFLNWNDSLDLIRSSPLAGTGPGSFYIAFRQYGDAALANSERFDDAHNIFLHLAVSGGIPLALFFAGILLLALGKGWQVVRLKRHPLAISLVAGLVGLIVAMSFNPVVVPCWFLLATLAVGLLVLSPDKQVAMSRLARYGFLVVAVLLIIYAFASLLNEHFTRNAIVAYRARDFARVERNSKLAGYFNPFGVTARSYWAMSAVQLGREPQQTERIIRYSLKLHPNSSADHQVAATVYYYLYRQTGDRKYLESMDKEIDRALSLEPRYAKLLGQAAYLYFKSEQLNKAIALQRNSLALDNTNFYSWLLLAKLYALTGQKQPAIAALEEASMLQPEVLLLKRLRDDLQQQPDPRSVYFPIQFPEPAI